MMDKVLVALMLCAVAANNAPSGSPRAVNWEQVDETVTDLFNTVVFNIYSLRVVGRTSVDREDLGANLLEHVIKANSSIHYILSGISTSIINQELDVPKARKYEPDVANTLTTLQDNIYNALHKSGPSGVRVCDLIKGSFDHSVRHFKDLRTLLRAE